MKTYRIGFFEDSEDVIKNVIEIVPVHDVSFDENHVHLTVDEETVTLDEIISLLQQTPSWDGTVEDLDAISAEAMDQEEDEKEEPIDELTKIFVDVDPNEVTTMIDRTVDNTIRSIGIPKEKVVEIFMSTVSWFLPFSGNPIVLTEQLKTANKHLENMLSSRLRETQLSYIIQSLEEIRDDDKTGCVDDVIALVNEHRSSLLAGSAS